MKLGFVIPTYPNERRVAILPQDIVNPTDELIVERGFGRTLEIPDARYQEKGCRIAERGEIFAECDTVFALKLLQRKDYSMIRPGLMIVGWTHPTGSGVDFMKEVVRPRDVTIVDLDNAYPKLYFRDQSVAVSWIPKNFICKNSFNAGFASTMHAFLCYGAYPTPTMNIAVLGNGNTAQGVFHILSKFTDNIRMYYRKTMSEFYANLPTFDVIVNGIEVDRPIHLLTKAHIAQTKPGCLFIDAAADAGNTIEGTHYTSIDNPIYEADGRYFYEVNNSPSLIFRNSSSDISRALATYVLKPGVGVLWNLKQQIG